MSDSRFRVLIVDDEPVNLMVLKNHLTKLGCEIIECQGGKQVVSMMDQGEQFNLMLVDLMMPFMSGYELCERVRERVCAKRTPIIVLSGRPRREDEEKAYALGANGFLLKPFAKEDLLMLVRNYMDQALGA